MAIIFDKALSTTELLNAYNNNIVEFHSDNGLAAVSCVINLGDVSFEITPDPNGQFLFNLKEGVKVLINSNSFEDLIVPDIEFDGYVYKDDTLFLSLGVDYELTLSDDSTETTAKAYKFFKSVKQPIKYSEEVIDGVNLSLLLPFYQNNKLAKYASYYEGYPFDFSLYSKNVATITITNKANGLTEDFNLLAGVNRIFISQGSANFTIDDVLPLITGMNELEISDGSETVTLYLEKFESKCSPMLKFFNDSGSYSYLRFEENPKITVRTKTLNTINVDFKDISETRGTNLITGKMKSTRERLQVRRMSPDQFKLFLDLTASPRVDLFMDDLFQKQESDSYYTVIMKDASYKYDDRRNLYNAIITIEYLNNTISL